jgi:hypothetical protein
MRMWVGSHFHPVRGIMLPEQLRLLSNSHGDTFDLGRNSKKSRQTLFNYSDIRPTKIILKRNWSFLYLYRV